MLLKDFIQLHKYVICLAGRLYLEESLEQNPKMTAYDHFAEMSRLHDVPFGLASRMATARYALVEFLDWGTDSYSKSLKTIFPELAQRRVKLVHKGWDTADAVNHVLQHHPQIVTPTRIFQALAEAYRGPEDKGKPYLHVYDPTKFAQKTSREKC